MSGDTTPAFIKKLARETADAVFGDMEARARSAYENGQLILEKIFLFDRLADLRKYIDTITISKSEFSDSIIACEARLIPWLHEISHRQFIPDHLHISEKDRDEMSKARVGQPLPKAFRKIMATFEERRLLVGHLFYHEDPELWHLFYFDQRDTEADRNHWKEGSHLHLINCLTHPRSSAEEVWQDFHDGNPKMKGALHVRCAFK
ncbi:MAG: hypothetical protein KF748_01265 [Xanthobacteraceae bacterium]|nr:hypothetical protein [Xanthobacteraceae bacterium]MBX3547762.1 hypothetical protein [Xanthobacteraceae bacterium]